ncbi:MAG: hypothetical protein ACSHWW_09810 [Nonlabens sp.]|uniref:hypothetical protein n=1 Tax=Nonlabens sp. TaxID=1888209 RepID=UPI003EF1C82D
MKKRLFVISCIVIMLAITSCKYFANETIESFEAIESSVTASNKEQTIEIESLMETIKDSAMANPAVYASAFNHSNEFHNKTSLLLTELQHARELINEKVGETGDYEKWDTSTDAIFFNGDEYSQVGTRFVQAIKNYNITSSDQLFFFPEAEKLAQKSFKIDDVLNRDGDTVDWLSYNFKGFPAIASKTKIAQLENEVKKVETTFLKALIEKPQF